MTHPNDGVLGAAIQDPVYSSGITPAAAQDYLDLKSAAGCTMQVRCNVRRILGLVLALASMALAVDWQPAIAPELITTHRTTTETLYVNGTRFNASGAPSDAATLDGADTSAFPKFGRLGDSALNSLLNVGHLRAKSLAIGQPWSNSAWDGIEITAHPWPMAVAGGAVSLYQDRSMGTLSFGMTDSSGNSGAGIAYWGGSSGVDSGRHSADGDSSFVVGGHGMRCMSFVSECYPEADSNKSGPMYWMTGYHAGNGHIRGTLTASGHWGFGPADTIPASWFDVTRKATFQSGAWNGSDTAIGSARLASLGDISDSIAAHLNLNKGAAFTRSGQYAPNANGDTSLTNTDWTVDGRHTVITESLGTASGPATHVLTVTGVEQIGSYLHISIRGHAASAVSLVATTGRYSLPVGRDYDCYFTRSNGWRIVPSGAPIR